MRASFEHAVDTFRGHGGILRMANALRAGISRRTLYSMRDEGVIDQLSRGVYRLSSMQDLAAPDLVTVAKRVPNGVVCLLSALDFHGLTTQVPHAVDLALVRGSEAPRIDYPPVNVYRFSGMAFSSGIDEVTIDSCQVRIYSPEKSIADAFKFRNRIGLDVVLEALKTWRHRSRPDMDRLLQFARICRVERVIRPYVEAML